MTIHNKLQQQISRVNPLQINTIVTSDRDYDWAGDPTVNYCTRGLLVIAIATHIPYSSVEHEWEFSCLLDSIHHVAVEFLCDT